MSGFLTVRSFPNQRAPTVEKIRSDGIRMYCEARYVIVLNEEGEVVEKINRSLTYTGNFLVVLAPVVYDEWKVNLSIVLEIGLSRSVPYQQFEKWFGKEKISVQKRRPVVMLSDEHLIYLMSVIVVAIQDVVDEEVSHRKSLVWNTPTTRKNGSYLLNGKFITIPLEITPLVFICLKKDFTARVEGHLSLFVKLTKEKLSTFKYAYYPKGQIKRFKKAKEIASILDEAQYPEHFINAVRKKLGKPTGKYRALFEQIIDEFKISFGIGNENDALLKKLDTKFEENSKHLLEQFPLIVVMHPKRDSTRDVHARNCIRVEIYPSEKMIQYKHPELFSQIN